MRNSSKAYESFYWGSPKKFDLTPCESLALFLIKGLSKKSGKCYASKKYLAETLNISQPTIFNTINNLINKGLIEKLYKNTNGVMLIKPTNYFNDYIESLKGIGVYEDTPYV